MIFDQYVYTNLPKSVEKRIYADQSKSEHTNNQSKKLLAINSIECWWWIRLKYESYIIQEFYALTNKFTLMNNMWSFHINLRMNNASLINNEEGSNINKHLNI